MEEVCCIIACEGFNVKIQKGKGTYRKEFLVRELAYVKIKKDMVYEPKSILFDLSKYKMSEFSPDDMKTISYQNKLHGLSFYVKSGAEEAEAEDIKDLNDLVRDIHKRCYVPGEAEAIAFKGGHLEQDILFSLDIPYLNLQSYGCPKFNDLNTGRPNYTNSCGYHLQKPSIHCPRATVAAFQDWMRKDLGYSVPVRQS